MNSANLSKRDLERARSELNKLSRYIRTHRRWQERVRAEPELSANFQHVRESVRRRLDMRKEHTSQATLELDYAAPQRALQQLACIWLELATVKESHS